MSTTEIAPRPVGWSAMLRKYVRIFQITLVERLTYRLDFIFTTFLRFLPMATTIMLWTAIFEGPPKRIEIKGYTLNGMISYLLLVHVSRMFSSMPGLAGSISRDIRDGSLKKYLLQPLDMIGYLLAYRVAHKVSYIVAVSLPYGILYFLCRDFFPGFPEPDIFIVYLFTLILGFIIGFHLEVCLGMVGFWILEVSSLLYIVNMINYFVSGHMFPLDLLPGVWPDILKCLPFNYLAYFPTAIFLGNIRGPELVRGVLLEIGWAVTFIVLARWLYARGLKRYSAFGG